MRLVVVVGVEGVIDDLPDADQKVYPLQVEDLQADQLISPLDEFNTNGQEGLAEVPAYGLKLVPHPSDNSCVNNSSNMISSWMRQMEITTIGWGLLAYWRVAR